MLRSSLALLVVFASFVAILLLSAGTTKRPQPLGRHIVLTARDEAGVPEVAEAIGRFADNGFNVTADTQRVVERLSTEDSDVTVFVVTRRALPSLPLDLLSDLYYRGVVVIGLDIAMREFSPPVIGYEAGISMVPYVPGKPAFSMLRVNCTGTGYTSDYLRGDAGLAELAIMRSMERCEAS